MNPLHPDLLTAEERLDEVARILATGILRLRKKQLEESEKNEKTESFPLDVSLKHSAHGRTKT